MVLNANNSTQKPPTQVIPYYLRKYKDQTQHQQQQTNTRLLSNTNQFIYTSTCLSSSASTTTCSSSASSICSSQHTTPSPSPLIHSDLIDTNNNSSTNIKNQTNSMMIQLCFDDPKLDLISIDNQNDLTLVNSNKNTPLNIRTTRINNQNNLRLSKTVQPNSNHQSNQITTRSKLRRQMELKNSHNGNKLNLLTPNIQQSSKSAFKPLENFSSNATNNNKKSNKSIRQQLPQSQQNKTNYKSLNLENKININNKNSTHSSELSCDDEDDYLTKITTQNLNSNLQNNLKQAKCILKKKKRASLIGSNSLANQQNVNYDEDDEEEDEAEEETILNDPNKPKVKFDQKIRTGRTPPHKKFRKLRLFDTPHTPKTLIKNSQESSIKSATKITSNITSISTNIESSSPPFNQLFKSSKLFNEIIVNANQTPKSQRRTPGLQSKQQAVHQLQQSPTMLISQDVEMQVELNEARGLRMRLFDCDNSNSIGNFKPKFCANKVLNFDDTDDNDENLEFSKPNFSDDEMKMLFSNPPPPTPLTTHSKSVPVTINNQNSVFKPIHRLGVNGNHIRTNSYSSSTSSNTYMIKSPHSPFQFNQLQANINPFTPTNSYDNSKLTSASNAAQMVKLAAANLAAANLTNNTPINGKQISINRNVKRCYVSTELNPELNENDVNLEEDLGSNQTSNITTATTTTTTTIATTNYNNNNINQNSNQTENLDNSLPRNKRLALRQCLVSRYHEEFHEVCKLGSGEFGDVFKCINRLDGCTYAIKRSKKPIAGSASEINAWKEVCAHAVLVKHNHIVQYYSAWAEADRMLIQNEYCNGGSLAEFIESLKLNNSCLVNEPSTSNDVQSNQLLMSEFDLKTLLLHIAKGLGYMHSLNLVHLDIKPGNIFICRIPRRTNQASSETNLVINEESGIESEELDDDDDSARFTSINKGNSLFSEIITYKIGDLGHVTSTLDPHVEEGDCRYLPNEILQEQYDNLTKADVFALALTVYVCGSLEELPKNGDEWHWIRRGNLKDLSQCSERFKKLLIQMVNENPVLRPSASTLVHHPCICPDANKSKAQLRKELNQEKFKNEMLQRKVRKYEQQINKITDSPIGNHHLNNQIITNQSVNNNCHKNQKFISIDLCLNQKNCKFTRSLSSSTII